MGTRRQNIRFRLNSGYEVTFPNVMQASQGWKLTSARRPLADDFQSGLTIFMKNRALSARLADDFLIHVNDNITLKI